MEQQPNQWPHWQWGTAEQRPPHGSQPVGNPQSPGWPGAPPGAWPQPAHSQPPISPGGFQSGSYGGLGAFSTDAGTQGPRSKKPFVIAGLSLIVLAGAGLSAWLTGLVKLGDVLDAKSVETGIVKVLKNSYGESDVRNPRCPEDEEIRNNHKFDCTVEVGGSPKAVTIRVLNDKPEFEVGAPRNPPG